MFPPPPQTGTPYTPAGGGQPAPSMAPPGMGMTPMGSQPTAPAAPAAQQMSQFGRGNDTMLMHVTPGEVQGLQQLAQINGTSLTTNPQTGLPEAGMLEDLLPTILGIAGMAVGIPPMVTAAVVGAGTGMATGNLEKGLMAGLGAFGGASLGGAMGLGAAGAGANAAGTAAASAAGATPTAALPAAMSGTASGVNAGLPTLGTVTGNAAAAGAGTPLSGLTGMASTPAAGVAQGLGIGPAAAPSWMTEMLGQRAGQQAANFGTKFAQTASGAGNAISPMRTGAAALGLAAPVMNAMQPRTATPEKEEGFNYEGPYRPSERTVRFKPPGTEGDSSEFQYFDTVNPYPGFVSAPQQGRGYAHGGEVTETPANNQWPPMQEQAFRPQPISQYEAAPGMRDALPFPPRSQAPLGYDDSMSEEVVTERMHGFEPASPRTPTVPGSYNDIQYSDTYITGGSGGGASSYGGNGGRLNDLNTRRRIASVF